MASRRGPEFERRVRDLFTSHGYVVVRSTVSKSPADLVALRADGARPLAALDAAVADEDMPLSLRAVPLRWKPLLVQAKVGGLHRFSPADWNELYSLALSSGSWPVLAVQEKEGRRHVVALHLLTGGRVARSRTWPMRSLGFLEVPDV